MGMLGLFGQNSGQPSGRGCGLHVIAGIVIAIVGVVMYLGHTEVNPVTQESQHVGMTPDQEIALGIQSAPEMAAQMGGEVSDPADPRLHAVQYVGNYVVTHSEAGKGPWQFQFHLLQDPQTINAFALPGGQVFITRGLLDKLQTEAQLAGVLGHECGHVIERHAAQQMAKGQLGQMLVMATGVGASDRDHPGRGFSSAVVAGAVNQMMQLRYSREDESQADEWGLKLMSEAAFDPKAMVEVMEILRQSSSGGHEPEIFATHPYPEHREERIQAYLQNHPPETKLTEGRNLSDLETATGRE